MYFPLDYLMYFTLNVLKMNFKLGNLSLIEFKV